MQWRWSDADNPINNLGPTHDQTVRGIVPLPPGTHRDANGQIRYNHDSALFDGFVMSPTERRRYYQPPKDGNAPALFDIDGVSYECHKVAFHQVIDTNGIPVELDGRPIYDIKVIGDGGNKFNGSKTLIKQEGKRWWHLDLENPLGRPGQLHLQYRSGNKQVRHIYDFHSDTFLPSPSPTGRKLSPKQLEEIFEDPEFTKAIEDARRRLNTGSTGDIDCD
jgi:hypothetical protein